MPAPTIIAELVERFEANREAYTSGRYNETQLRREFVDPFFKALGWDVWNEQGYAEAYKDVVHEEAIRIGGETGTPDYRFRIGEASKFLLEAKRPSVDIKADPAPAYQLRRYAWTAGLPLNILTNFREFAVYDGRVKPAARHKASIARVLYLTCDEYLPRWDEIAAVFSRGAVLKGSFDRYAEATRRKGGTAEVDAEFLKEIEGWRDVLARNLALRNPDLSQRDLNYAVQATIDRIIFLRICEARGIEPYGRLYALLNGERVYPRLFHLFQRADERYNSGLFHFTREKDRPTPPDTLTPGLEVDDKPLKDILRNLYYPDCPYEFSVLPSDILGHVYEQFLGKVIRLTAGHHAVVEEKPEVRKAGGVYYTPTYIVDYIVKETVGATLEGKTPKHAASLRILDPACGSGSFLLGAYQHLLDWHLEWYTANDPEKYAKGRNPAIYQVTADAWRLTTAERKRILLNNVYGVDIDPQAVEVTKLSLLLKVLESESAETLRRQFELFHERALPDLSGNIRCGNSVIGPDFYNGNQMDLFDDEARLRANVFDWPHEFPEILGGGAPGFDAVIGNPPYVRPHNIEPVSKEYFWKHYRTFVKKSDLYCCFIERATRLLRKGGALGFIVSNGFLRLDSFEKLRCFLLDQVSLKRIVDFTGNVFPQATVKTAMLLSSRGTLPKQIVQVATTAVTPDLESLRFKRIAQDGFRQTYKSIFDFSIDGREAAVKEKMRSARLRLGERFELSFGLKTGDDERFLTREPRGPEYKPLLRGADVHRYLTEFKGEYVWFVPGLMREHRRTARPGTAARFEQPKVLIRDTGEGLQGTFDGEKYYVKDVVIVTDAARDARALKALTGLLNSRLMRFYYETSFPTLHVQRDELASLPIRGVEPGSPREKSRLDRLVRLVDRMLALHRSALEARTPHGETALRRQIEATDQEIDQLVYELYGLNDDERRVVEEAQGE